MRTSAVLALALTACGARTELGAPDPAEPPSCGDGEIDPGEACDAGDRNADQPALAVRQGRETTRIAPFFIETTAVEGYRYESKSAHTGIEALETSWLFFTFDPRGELSLVTVHGIDFESSGEQQPAGRVRQVFSELPQGFYVAFSDDYAEEFGPSGPREITGRWEFQLNTDGGIIGGLPFPGRWEIGVESRFTRGIEAWHVYAPGISIGLEEEETAYLVAFDEPGPCRTDCTLPACGDGILDGGEICDDGNTAAGDGCSPACSGP